MSGCEIERRCVVHHASLNIVTGAFADSDKTTVEIKPCGAPLFSERERKLGVCRSCLNGWTHPHNKATETGERQLEEAKRAALKLLLDKYGVEIERETPRLSADELCARLASVDASPDDIAQARQWYFEALELESEAS